jgi:hypothetical protein
VNTRIRTRQSIALLGITLALVATACGTKSSAASQVASLGSTDGTTPTATTVPVNTQDALLKYAACMRTNGVDMADPTFDADGNPTGGGFGRNSGVDRSTPAFQTAQKACGNLLQGVRLGGGRGGNFNPQAIQDALNDFTACLRDQGLAVDDITFGRPGGAAGANGGTGGATAGSVPGGGGGFGGGFGGPPPGGSAPANGGANGGRGPGGAGFDPTARLIERLGLDNTDPKVVAALAKCQPLITKAFQPPTSTTTATTP